MLSWAGHALGRVLQQARAYVLTRPGSAGVADGVIRDCAVAYGEGEQLAEVTQKLAPIEAQWIEEASALGVDAKGAL